VLFRATWIAAEKFLPAPSDAPIFLTWKDFPSNAVAGSTCVMKMFVRLHQIKAIVRSREEHAARTINACAAAGLRDMQEC
jgi:hypothetical protein